MKSLAAREMWARRLAQREGLLLGGKSTSDGAYAQHNRLLILALCEAYSAGYHDHIQEEIATSRGIPERSAKSK